MKKLLFLTNIAVISIMVSSCGNNKPSKTSKSEEVNQLPPPQKMVTSSQKNNAPIQKTDTLTQKTSSTEHKTDDVQKKTKAPKVQEAPKHQSPNPSELDSMKRAKAKSKFK